MRILVIEDNQRLCEVLTRNLTAESYAVDAVHDGWDGQSMAEITTYDAIILDIMLPGKDGMEVCSALRRQRINTPIILLTARENVNDRVRGLDSGADDYLVKPFAMQELLARLRALVRRVSPDKTGFITVSDLVLDPATHFVERGGQRIELSSKEYALVEYFMRNANRLVTREMLEENIWNYDFAGVSNIIDVYMRRLRRKIDNPFEIKLFETIRGSGYRLRQPS